MNKRGFTVLSMIASFAIFALIIIVVSNFKTYLVTHKVHIADQQTFYMEIDNELASIYSNEWVFEEKVKKTDSGELHVKKQNLGMTEFNTQKMKVDFELKGLTKSIEVERSRYYE